MESQDDSPLQVDAMEAEATGSLVLNDSPSTPPVGPSWELSCIELRCEREGCGFIIHGYGYFTFHCGPCHTAVIIQRLNSTIRALEDEKQEEKQKYEEEKQKYEEERVGLLTRISELEGKQGQQVNVSVVEGAIADSPEAKRARTATAAGELHTPSSSVSPTDVIPGPLSTPSFSQDQDQQ